MFPSSPWSALGRTETKRRSYPGAFLVVRRADSHNSGHDSTNTAPKTRGVTKLAAQYSLDKESVSHQHIQRHSQASGGQRDEGHTESKGNIQGRVLFRKSRTSVSGPSPKSPAALKSPPRYQSKENRHRHHSVNPISVADTLTPTLTRANS